MELYLDGISLPWGATFISAYLVSNLTKCLFDGCISIDNIIRQHCFSLRDEFRSGVAQFLRESITLRDCVGKYGFSSVLSKDEISCIIDYLANM